MHRKRYLNVVLAALLGAGCARIAAGADLYVTDPSHTTVSFTVRHLAIYKVRGKFNDFSGTLMYDEHDLTKSSMHGTINVASIDTDNEKRDNDLRGEQFLDAERFPAITFASKRVEARDGGPVLLGDLTIHGVTKEIAMPFTITGTLDQSTRF
jgi:polyisoprenoid-binding protein YceI